MFALTDLLPLNDPEVMSKFFHYKGSLTTPPCLEVVNWYVFEDPIYVSEAQVRTLLWTSLCSTRNLGCYQKPWVLPGTLGITRNLGYYQEPWVLQEALGITRNLGYYQEPWVLPEALGITRNLTRNLGFYQEPWIIFSYNPLKVFINKNSWKTPIACKIPLSYYGANKYNQVVDQNCN